MRSYLYLISAAMLTGLSSQWSLQPASAADDLAIANGLDVTLELTVRLADQTTVASNRGDRPLTYIHGQQQILPSLEQNLTGMKAGEHKIVHLAADQGFGQYDPAKRVTVPRTQLPADSRVGGFLRSSQGAMARVVEMDDHSAVLDLNHPLAGESLDIEVTILHVESVRDTISGAALETAS